MSRTCSSRQPRASLPSLLTLAALPPLLALAHLRVARQGNLKRLWPVQVLRLLVAGPSPCPPRPHHQRRMARAGYAASAPVAGPQPVFLGRARPGPSPRRRVAAGPCGASFPHTQTDTRTHTHIHPYAPTRARATRAMTTNKRARTHTHPHARASQGWCRPSSRRCSAGCSTPPTASATPPRPSPSPSTVPRPRPAPPRPPGAA